MRRLTVVLPALFLLALLLLTTLVLDPVLPGAAAVVASFGVATMGIVLFSRAVFEVVEGLQGRLQAQNDQLRSLHEAGIQITSDLELAAVLENVVESSRIVVGARYGAIAVLDQEGRIAQFISSGLSEAERRRIGHIPEGRGLLGKVLREGRPYRTADIATDPNAAGFPPDHPVMKTFLGVPIVAKSRVIGDLYLTDKHTGEFTEADEEVISAFAVQAAIAIENAMLYEKVQDIAVFEERERIGMDLHDGAIQQIYAVQLRLEDGLEHLDAEPASTRTAINKAIESLDDIIRDIRGYIFHLRPTRLEGKDLAGALEELLRETRVNTLMEANLELDEREGKLSELLTPEQAFQLFQVAHEAVTNARKHARAGSISIELGRRDGSLVLQIADNGRGIPPEPERSRGGRGLTNIAERVSALGGRFTVDSEPGKGTTLRVEVPLVGEGVGGSAEPEVDDRR
jgi:signal transduction histidine kinase